MEVPLLDLGNGPLALEAVSITLDRNPKLDDRILDYEIVYHDGFYFSHSDHLGSNTVSRIEETAENVFVALGIDCVGRVDFRIDHGGSCWVTDVATSPHLVKHSSFAFAFERANRPHSDVLGAVVAANAIRQGWC